MTITFWFLGFGLAMFALLGVLLSHAGTSKQLSSSDHSMVPSTNPYLNGTQELSAEAIHELRNLKANGKSIAAIKRYRKLTGTDIAEAKNFVDRL